MEAAPASSGIGPSIVSATKTTTIADPILMASSFGRNAFPLSLRHALTGVDRHLGAHFDDMSTEVVEEYQQYEGEPFRKYMKHRGNGDYPTASDLGFNSFTIALTY